jgi:hypothetical protein
MKVWISNYRNDWISPYTILEKVFFWREIDYDESIIKTWYIILNPFCEVWQKIHQIVFPRFDYVKIDRWDTWSMDHTLAHIILPMLKQLKKDKHGAPFTNDKDVPKELRSTSAKPKDDEWDTDEFHFQRWDYILDEMIWAFEQKVTDDDESQFYDHSDCKGLPFEETIGKLKVDRKGLKAHQTRKQNGYRLFGAYYQALWD